MSVVNNLQVYGVLSSANATDSTSVSTGSFVAAGGIGIAKRLNVGGVVSMNSAVESSSTGTGSLVVAGGLGVASRVNIGGAVAIASATPSTTPATGALAVVGGVGVGGSINVAGRLVVSDITGSSGANTGAVVVSGGLGVGQNVNIGAPAGTSLSVASADNSTSITTGAVIIEGGMAVKKSVFIQGDLTVQGTTTTIDTDQTTIKDTFYGCGTGNAGDSNALGMWMKYVDTSGSPTTKYAGFFRNALLPGRPFTFFNECLDNLASGINTPTMYQLASISVASLNLGGALNILDPTESTSISTGSITTAGGIGIAKSVNIGGRLFVKSLLDATTALDGAAVVSGGLSVGASIFAGGKLTVADLTAATASTGALRVNGGLSVGLDIYGAGLISSSAVAATSASTGAIRTLGGIGAGGDIWSGGSVNATSLYSSLARFDRFGSVVVRDNSSGGSVVFDALGNYNVAANPERYIYCENSPAQNNVSVNLPAIAVSGTVVFVAKCGATSATANVVIAANGTDKIDDGITATITLSIQYQRITLVSYKPFSGNSVWFIQ